MSAAQAIQTRYAGCHFRSRLEARWAVFFDELHIPWEYEPEGYELSFRRYLPDFLLTDCGTFIEVRGANERVDLDELQAIAAELPALPLGRNSYTNEDGETTWWNAERGPRLMLLGPIPTLSSDGDPGWVSLQADRLDEAWLDRCGFGEYHKNKRPWWHDGSPLTIPPLKPTFARWEYCLESRIAYMAARSARFEHGQSGPS